MGPKKRQIATLYLDKRIYIIKNRLIQLTNGKIYWKEGHVI